MPSPEYSALSNKSRGSQTNSYDKIIAIVNDSTSDPSPINRRGRISVSLVTSNKFNDSLGSVPDDQYKRSAGAGLSSLFAPFKTSIATNERMPHFHKGVNPAYSSTSGTITLMDILPFEWDNSATNSVYDRNVRPSGDSIPSLVSSDKSYGNIDRFRDLSDIRAIGQRLPIVGVGWGYTRDNIAMPSGSDATRFSGEGDRGWKVDPREYIAAPIDFRYDRGRHVWTSSLVRILEGQVVAPPNGIPFTDNRYYVKPQRHRQRTNYGTTPSGLGKWNPEHDTNPEWTDGPLIVTNLLEQVDGTHGLPEGQYVPFYEVTNVLREPGAKPVTFYIMSEVGGNPSPQYQFMVYQGVASNEPGWDFVRAHPTL